MARPQTQDSNLRFVISLMSKCCGFCFNCLVFPTSSGFLSEKSHLAWIYTLCPRTHRNRAVSVGGPGRGQGPLSSPGTGSDNRQVTVRLRARRVDLVGAVEHVVCFLVVFFWFGLFWFGFAWLFPPLIFNSGPEIPV